MPDQKGMLDLGIRLFIMLWARQGRIESDLEWQRNE